MSRFFLLILFISNFAFGKNLCSDLFQNHKSNSPQILIDRTAVNQQVFDLIKTAKTSLDVSISSIPNERLVRELIEKAQKGVHVRLILDGRHFQKAKKDALHFNTQISALKHPNIEIRVTSQHALSANRQYHAAVLHRKIVIVDQKEIYVGSSNLTDGHNNPEIGLFTIDKNKEILNIFETDFKNASDRSFEAYARDEKLEPSESTSGLNLIGPNTQRPDIQQELVKIIDKSEKRLWIAVDEMTDPVILKALLDKRVSNPSIDMRILLNEAEASLWIGSKKYLHRTNEETWNRLLKEKIPVKVYREQGSILHARFAVSDRDIMVGSFDFTQRSFKGNIDLGFMMNEPQSVDYVAEKYTELWDQSFSPSKSKFSIESTLANLYENKVLPHLSVKSAPKADLKTTFGWEVEFNFSESPNVLKYYRLKKYSDEKWAQLSEQERIQAVQSYIQQVPQKIRPVLTALHMTMLYKVKDAPTDLPNKALIESHGTVELVGEVEASVSSLEQKTAQIENLIGAGYWQSHIAFPKMYSENISGWVSFSSDKALVDHLEGSYERYLNNPSEIPAKVLVHYALGPLDQGTLNNIKAKEKSALRGQQIGKGGNDRLIFGPAFRDDPYPNGLAGVELRQFSKQRAKMMETTERFSQMLIENKLFLYNGFKETKMLEHKIFEMIPQVERSDWVSFFNSVNSYLKRSSPNNVVGGAGYDIRFLIPLRDWEGHPVVALSKLSDSKFSSLKDRLALAKNEYMRDVQRIISDNSPMEKKVELLRIAVAKWAKQASLSELFQNFQNESQ